AAADDFDTCFKASGGEAVLACERAIASGGYKGRDLALLHGRLCNGRTGRYRPNMPIEDCDEAIRLDPNFTIAYHNRRVAWASKCDNDRAIADYTEAIRLDPKYGLAYYNRGRAWSAKGDNDRAIADYDQAIRLDPKIAAAYSNRGVAWT